LSLGGGSESVAKPEAIAGAAPRLPRKS